MRSKMIPSRPRGYALVTVLWMGLGLLLGAAAFLSESRQSALGARAEIEAARALELARSGINFAMADLGRVGESAPKSRRDGTWVELRMAEGRVRYAIRDENGKVDINAAPVQLLRPVFEAIGAEAGFDAFDASNLAEAVVSIRQSRGQLGLAQLLAEVGLDARTVTIARRYLTSFNFDPQVNPLTAPEVVLRAVPGLGPNDVATLMSIRQTGGALPRLGTASLWLVALEGPVFTIEAEAELEGGATASMQVRLIQQGLSFRGGKMLYEVVSTSIQF